MFGLHLREWLGATADIHARHRCDGDLSVIGESVAGHGTGLVSTRQSVSFTIRAGSTKPCVAESIANRGRLIGTGRFGPLSGRVFRIESGDIVNSQEKKRRRTERLLAKGPVHFVFLHGVIFWGLGSAATLSLVMVGLAGASFDFIWKAFLAFGFGGIFWGLAMWGVIKTVYSRNNADNDSE